MLLDKELREAIEDIVIGRSSLFGDLRWNWLLYPLGLVVGFVLGSPFDGLRGTISYFDFISFTSKNIVPSKVQHVLASSLFSKRVQDMDVKCDMPTRQKTFFGCLQASRAHEFNIVIPIYVLGQHMPNEQYHIFLKYFLVIPSFPIDEVFPVCCKACLNTFREHTLHCKELPIFKYHYVRDILFDIFRHARSSMKKKTPLNLLSNVVDGRSTLMATNVLVYRWVGGKYAYVDLTGFVTPKLVKEQTLKVLMRKNMYENN